MQKDSDIEDGFITLPANAGGQVLARRADICGGRPHDNGGCILYLRPGPSIYVAATIAQVATALGAEAAQLRRE